MEPIRRPRRTLAEDLGTGRPQSECVRCYEDGLRGFTGRRLRRKFTEQRRIYRIVVALVVVVDKPKSDEVVDGKCVAAGRQGAWESGAIFVSALWANLVLSECRIRKS